jgi:uncharacterized protein YdeI (YjbR/CyaY-like superfamily)
MKRCKTVDEFIAGTKNWQDELVQLREILHTTGLEETVKWGAPAYTHKGKNIVGIGSFKSYFGLWFFQGALLSDKKKVLINAQEGRTKALRQWRMSSSKDISSRTIKAYVKEAVSIAESGQEIKPDRSKPVVVPVELKTALVANKKAGAEFKNMTPGKRREYADYISAAKRPETKQKRLEKILPMLKNGIGLNDKYRNC